MKIKNKTKIRKEIVRAEGNTIAEQDGFCLNMVTGEWSWYSAQDLKDAAHHDDYMEWSFASILSYIRREWGQIENRTDLHKGITWFFRDLEANPEAHQ